MDCLYELYAVKRPRLDNPVHICPARIAALRHVYQRKEVAELIESLAEIDGIAVHCHVREPRHKAARLVDFFEITDVYNVNESEFVVEPVEAVAVYGPVLLRPRARCTADGGQFFYFRIGESLCKDSVGPQEEYAQKGGFDNLFHAC